MFWGIFSKPSLRGLFALVLLLALLIPGGQAQGAAACQEGVQPGGARYRACLPEGAWNGDLVLYAHGYTPAEAPLALPGEAARFGDPLRALGYAFATTSYRVNGLAVLPAQEDLLDLVRIFTETYGEPERVFLIGASEGGLITALSVERSPEVYAGGLEMCGPVGSFQGQLNYFGDFRVVFDAYFPGRIPGPPLQVPEEVRARWPAIYQNQVAPLLNDPASLDRLVQVLAVTGAPYDPRQPGTVETTLRGVLSYAVGASGDAAAWMNGLPFDNTARTYRGSADDAWLNSAVQRIAADPEAQAALQPYETGGQLVSPLVGLHTTGDEIVPFIHLEQYAQKAGAASPGLFVSIPVERYGHCNFTQEEILDAFQQMVRLADQNQAARQSAGRPTVSSGATAAGSETAAGSLSAAATPQPVLRTPTPGGLPAAPAGLEPRADRPGLWQRIVRFLQGLVQL